MVVEEEGDEGVSLARPEGQPRAFHRGENLVGFFVDTLDHAVVRVIIEHREAHAQGGVAGHLCMGEGWGEGVWREGK